MSGTKVLHKFIRCANHESGIYSRVANRFAPFENTLSHLEDPKTGRKLHLIGTTNSSTTLAHRTKQLLETVKPDAVYVQTSPQWWQYSQHLDVNTQKIFTMASKDFPEKQYKFEHHLRGILFKARYYIWKYYFDSMLQKNEDFNLFTPGLETYFALQHAKKTGADTIFGGNQFDPITLEGLRTQPDMYPHTMLWRAYHKLHRNSSSYDGERQDFFDTLHVRGGQAFAESMDRSRANFLVSMFNMVAPKQKKIIVDLRDERIFRDLYHSKSKNMVAVVNQWHMQGIETHWRRITKTEIPQKHLSPVADMDIDAIQEVDVVNNYLRDRASKVTKSEPATHQNYLFHYHKQHYEYERTRHTHHNSHEDIPEPTQYPKPNDVNKNI